MVDTSNLPIGTKTPPTVDKTHIPSLPELIVCAAAKNEAGEVICSIRHFDKLMNDQMDLSPNNWDNREIVQGFITNRNRFVDRVEGLAIATAQKQIKRMVGGGDKFLSSEMLY